MATDRFAAGMAPRRPRCRQLVAVAVVAPLLAACGSGFHAETNQIYQPGPGITVRVGGVYSMNTLIVTDGHGNGTLVGALINQRARPDELQSVRVSNRAGKVLDSTIISGTIALPSQRAVQLADTGDVRVRGALDAGSYCTLTLTFAHAAPVNVEIPVVSASSDFRRVPLGPVPPPTTPSHSNPSRANP